MFVTPAAVGPLMVALGSVGAIGIGPSLSCQQTANFTFSGNGGGSFLLDFLTSTSFGRAFDSAVFQLSLNDNLPVNSRSLISRRLRRIFQALGRGPISTLRVQCSVG